MGRSVCSTYSGPPFPDFFSFFLGCIPRSAPQQHNNVVAAVAGAVGTAAVVVVVVVAAGVTMTVVAACRCSCCCFSRANLAVAIQQKGASLCDILPRPGGSRENLLHF